MILKVERSGMQHHSLLGIKNDNMGWMLVNTIITDKNCDGPPERGIICGN